MRKLSGRRAHLGLSRLARFASAKGIEPAQVDDAVIEKRFRIAAATLWSIRDPANVRGVKDLLGHSSFATTEKHYIMSQSRLAGRALARAIGNVERDQRVPNSIS